MKSVATSVRSLWDATWKRSGRNSKKFHELMSSKLNLIKAQSLNKCEPLGFPASPVVKNSPSNAGDTGSTPSQRRVPHASC